MKNILILLEKKPQAKLNLLFAWRYRYVVRTKYVDVDSLASTLSNKKGRAWVKIDNAKSTWRLLSTRYKEPLPASCP